MDLAEIRQIVDRMTEATKKFVASVETDLSRRIEELKQRIDAIPPQGHKGDKGDPGAKGADGKDIEPADVLAMVDRAVAAIPIPKDGERGDPGPAGKDGVDIDMVAVDVLVNARVAEAVGKIPPAANGKDGKDGQNVDAGAVTQRIVEEIRAQVAKIPPPKDGESIKGDKGDKGDPGAPSVIDMKAVDQIIGDRVAVAIAALPKAKDGKDGESVKGEKGDPGADADMDAIARSCKSLINSAISDAIAAMPKPKDGKDGTDGQSIKGDRGDVGEPGRDAAALNILPSIDESKGYRRGTWASHRGGLINALRNTEPVVDGNIVDAGWTVFVEGLCAPPIVLQSEDNPREFEIAFMLTSGVRAITQFRIPSILDRGVWREGAYEKGDHVSWDGSGWIAQRDTSVKPGNAPEDWRLSTKRGRDGKDADGKPAARQVVKIG